MSVADALALMQQAPAPAAAGASPGAADAAAGAPAAGGVSRALALLQSAPSAPTVTPKPSIASAEQLSQGATLPLFGWNTGIPLAPGLDRFLVGVGHGANSILQGAGELGLDALHKLGIGGGNAQALRDRMTQGQQLYDATQPTTGMKVGDFLGQTGASLPLALATDGLVSPVTDTLGSIAPAALRGAAPVLSNVARGVAQGVTTGAALPVLNGQSRGANVGLGALVGGAAPLALDAAKGGLSALRNAVAPDAERAAAGVLRGAATGPLNVQAPATPGVQFTLGQATRDPGVLAMENALRMRSNVPFLEQAQSNNRALNVALDQLAPKTMPAADDAVKDTLTGGLKAAKDQAKTLYGEVSDLAQGAQPIVPTNLRGAAQGLLGQYSDLFDRPGLTDPALKSKLSAILGALDTPEGARFTIPGSPGAPAAAPTAFDPFALGTPPAAAPAPAIAARGPVRVGPSGFDPMAGLGNAPAPQGTPASWNDLRWLNKRLNNFYGRAAKSAGAAGGEELSGISGLLRSVKADQQALADASGNPDLIGALQQANQHYQTAIAPFKDGPLKAAVSNDLTNAGATLVRPGAPNQGSLVDAALSAQPGAKDALAHAYFARLADAARTNTVDAGSNRILSPSGLMGFLDESQPLMDRLGSPQSRAAAEGVLSDLNTLGSGTAIRVKGGSDTTGQIAGLADLTKRIGGKLAMQSLLARIPLASEFFEPMLRANEEKVQQRLLQALLNPQYGQTLMSSAIPTAGMRGAPWAASPALLYLHQAE